MAIQPTDPMYPEIDVPIITEKCEPTELIGRAKVRMRNFGLEDEQIDQFEREARSGDFDHLLNTMMEWVNISR